VTSQPGWHPDPTQPPGGPPYGQPAQLRYWDGSRWTEHTAPAQAPAATQHYAAPQVYGGPRPAATTPDGVPLAGWWQRAGALVLDSILLGIVGGIAALPWIRDAWHIYVDWIDDALRTSEAGSSNTIDTAQLQRDLVKPLAIIGAINLALGFVYNVGFLMWKQATPGKLLLGLRVRLRETPGPMTLGTVLLRWLGQYGVGILGLVPYVGSIGGIYSLLNYLWPLWDDKKQALHDKLAKTNVVRTR
jgi:uncharacterized RDD family membrane protein YckC